MLRYMLDTDICIYVLKNHPPHIKDQFNDHSGHLCISSVTLAELTYGAEKSSKPVHNLNIIENFVSRLEVLSFHDKAASHYGQIRASLEKAGQPIGPYDLMIAAHARSEGLCVVTNNGREFKRVEGLRVENWVEE